MNLEKARTKANELMQYTDKFISYYNDITKSLTNIYDIVSKTSSEQSKKISDLINCYNEFIKKISVDYMGSVEQILDYFDNFNYNLNDFESSVANIAKDFSDMLNNIDRFDGAENKSV